MRTYGYDTEKDGPSIWVLAVDPGRWCGWVLLRCPVGKGRVALVAFGQLERPTGELLHRLARWAEIQCYEGGGDRIWLACEQQFATRDSNTKRGYARATDMIGVAQMAGKWICAAEAHEYPVVLIHPSTWRTRVLGCKANVLEKVAKRMALQFAKAKHGKLTKLKVKEHHVAEALCIGHHLAKALQLESVGARQGVIHGT